MNRQGGIEIREIEQPAEFRAAEDLQKEAWGFEDRDVVPLNQLRAAREAGGVVIGAFEGPELIGFVYGFLGLDRGRAVMHSHMLAVKRSHRGRSLGFRLKLAQRQRTLEQGITEITWTFDPLQSLNAYLNFQRLGVTAERYKVDFYGASASSLHQLGTDRLWVNWSIDSERVRTRLESPPETGLSKFTGVTPLVRCRDDGSPCRSSAETPSGVPNLVEIPGDIGRLQLEDMDLARRWRLVTREAFLEAFQMGYRVEEFMREDRQVRLVGTYVLVQPNRDAGKG